MGVANRLLHSMCQVLDKFNEMFNHLHQCGRFHIETDKDVIESCGFDSYQAGDVAIAWDLMDDELTDVETEILHALLNQCFSEICDRASFINAHQVFDADGSGNGLHYGLMVYRP